jgi:hypothetical protein
MLKSMRRQKPLPGTNRGAWPDKRDPQEDDLAVLQSLAGQGLVEEFRDDIWPSIPSRGYSNARQATDDLKKVVKTLSRRCFRLNRFGEDFLLYFGAEEDSADAATGSVV